VNDLTDPTTATLAVADALERAGLLGAVYGGLALAAYGEPRETKDADLAVSTVSVTDALAALEAAGSFEDGEQRAPIAWNGAVVPGSGRRGAQGDTA
jgi:hypothetical protein